MKNTELSAHHLTLMSSSLGVPQKTFRIDPEAGDLKKELSEGINAKHFRAACITYASLSELRDNLVHFRNSAGFVPHRNVHCVVDSDEVAYTTRCTKDFDYSCGVVFDVDVRVDNAFGIRTVSDVINILASVMPEIARTPYLWNYSSSANIFAADGTRVSEKLGFHIRFMTETPWTLDDFKVLRRRLVIAGYGCAEPTKHGQMQIKTVFDHVTQQPHWWFIEALPDLQDGLYRPPGSDDFHLVVPDGSRFALPAVAASTDEEHRLYAATEESLKHDKRRKLGLWTPDGDKAVCTDRAGRQHAVPLASAPLFFRDEEDDCLEAETTVITADGKRMALKEIDAKTSIYSPFREESHPSAFVGLNKHGVRFVYDSGLDRSFWPKPASLYDRVQVDERIELNQRYISNALAYQNGITFLCSGIGTGKTTALGRYIGERINADESVLYLCHRTALAEQVAKQHGLAYYKQPDALKEPRLAICIDSVYKLGDDAKLFQHVIIDESEQLIRHLTGDTLKATNTRRSHRFKVADYFNALLRQAKSVIAIDAHLSQLTKGFLRALMPNAHTRELVNGHAPYMGQPLEMWESGEAMLNDFYESVGRNLRIGLAADTKRIAENIFTKVARDYPAKRGLLITADGHRFTHGKGNASVSAPSKTDDEPFSLDAVVGKVDFFVYSPSIGTGYSIDHVTYDVVYGHFTHLIPSDNVQQLGRIRKARCRKVYYKNSVATSSPSRIVYGIEDGIRYNHETIETLESFDVRFRMDENMRDKVVDASDEGFVRLYTNVRYYEHRQRKQGVALLERLLLEQGYVIHPVAHSKKHESAGTQIIKEGAELVATEYRNGVLNASKLPENEVKALQARTSTTRTSDENFGLQRYELEAFYKTTVDEGLLDFDDGGLMRKRLPVFESLFMPMDHLICEDLRHGRNDSMASWESQTVRVVVFREVCECIFGFTDFKSLDNIVICNEWLRNSGLFDVLKGYERHLNRCFGTAVPRNIKDRPADYVRRVFSEFGIRLHPSQQASVRQARHYLGVDFVSGLGDVEDSTRIRYRRVDQDHFRMLITYARIRCPRWFNGGDLALRQSVA